MVRLSRCLGALAYAWRLDDGRPAACQARAGGGGVVVLFCSRLVINAFTDPDQLAATTDISLCHGFAGLAHVAARVADDALPATADQLRSLIPALLAAVHVPGSDAELAATALIDAAGGGPGFLDGAAGVALAVLAPSSASPPSSGWDACLLIS